MNEVKNGGSIDETLISKDKEPSKAGLFFKRIWGYKKILFGSLGGAMFLVAGIVLYVNFAPRYEDGGGERFL